MHIVILTLGSRGDVQPYVALGLGLQAAGYGVTIAALDDYESLVTGNGLGFFPLGLRLNDFNINALIAANEAGSQAPREIGAALGRMRPALAQVMQLQVAAARHADGLIASVLATFAAQPCAEKFGIPYGVTVLQPIGRTRSFPSPSLPVSPPPVGALNLLTHRLVELFFTLPLRGMINHLRQTALDLPPTRPWHYPYTHLNGRPIPWLHAYSPTVVPHPADWPSFRHTTGYWTLPIDDNWQPPADLTAFLAAGAPPVFVGFGSMALNDDPARLRLVIEALDRAGQRGVLAVRPGEIAGANLPDTIFPLTTGCPHEWLFPRMAAVVHHGGAGTTGAGLRSGVPSIIIPIIADQPFWAKRVAALGAGPAPIPHKKLTAGRLAYALRVAVTHEGIRARAAALGARIRAEDGVGNAVRIIEAEIARFTARHGQAG